MKIIQATMRKRIGNCFRQIFPIFYISQVERFHNIVFQSLLNFILLPNDNLNENVVINTKKTTLERSLVQRAITLSEIFWYRLSSNNF